MIGKDPETKSKRNNM